MRLHERLLLFLVPLVIIPLAMLAYTLLSVLKQPWFARVEYVVEVEWLVAFCVLGTGLASLWMVGRVARSIAEPIQTSVRQMQRLAQGERQTPLHVEGASGEVQDLVEGLEQLRLDLSTYEDRLQQQSRDETMGRVSRQVAHDIRSPLTALRVLVSHAQDVPEEQRITMRNAVQRIEDIANDLQAQQAQGTVATDAAADDPGALAVHLLSSLIEPMISEKRTLYRAKLGVEIHAALDAASYGVFAAVPAAEFKRVVSNLVNNAVEAMNRGTVTVAVRVEDDVVRVTVTDTGKGIPPELLPRLMQQGVTFGKADGSGLGLFHARTTVEAWGGTVTLASTVGVGTTVTLTLPRAAAPAWFVPTLELTPGSTVVIVDDDVTIHQIWQERMEGLGLPPPGITLHHFSSGDEVRAWYQGQTNTLFLCDYEFLGTPNNGLELIAQLGVAGQAILVTSHYEEAPVQARCAALGVRLIPKGLAGFVPLRVGAAAGRPATAAAESAAAVVTGPPSTDGDATTAAHPLTAIVIEDDADLRMVWPMEARRLGLAAVTTFASLEECEAAQPNYAQFDFAFVDKNIPDSAYRIDQVIERLKARGVKRVFVASGESARTLTRDPLCAAADGIIPMKIPQKLPR